MLTPSNVAPQILALTLLITGLRGATAASLGLVNPDQPAPIIVIGSQATASEAYAAAELSSYLGKIAGRKVEIVDDRYELAPRFNHGLVIAVGRSTRTASEEAAGLGPEQYVIDVRPDTLVIVGGRRPAAPGQPARDAGTLYGVYEFLEGLGVRWYRPEPWGEHVPVMKTIRLDIGRKVSPEPPYAVRATMSGGMSYSREETWEDAMQARTWAARNRTNAGFTDGKRWPGEAAKFGHLEEHALGRHSWPELVPASGHFETHPEYFALVKGRRVSYDLCPGNPELQRLVADKIIARAKQEPHRSSLSVEPSDCRGGTCECALCKALDGPRNTRPNGQCSNRVSAFGNIVARMVAKEAPWLKIQWLAYSTHTSAPTNLTRLEPNTIIMLAPINGWDDWRTELLDRSNRHNTMFVGAAKDWAALKPSCLMAFLYFNGYGWPGPLPIARTVADRMRNYRALGINGLYLPSAVSWGPAGLDFYMTLKLAWNPDLDIERELGLYYRNYYGPAAGPMKAYHERLMDALAASPYSVQSGGRGMHLVFTPALVKELGVHMSQARQQVGGNGLYERRLHGAWAGYEFSRRICEILVLKKRTGVVSVKVPEAERLALPRDLARAVFTGAGSYYQSAEAEDAYRELVTWMRQVGAGDAVFDMAIRPKHDAAKVIFAKRGHNFGAPFLSYLPQDVLISRNQHLRQEDLLKDF